MIEGRTSVHDFRLPCEFGVNRFDGVSGSEWLVRQTLDCAGFGAVARGDNKVVVDEQFVVVSNNNVGELFVREGRAPLFAQPPRYPTIPPFLKPASQRCPPHENRHLWVTICPQMRTEDATLTARVCLLRIRRANRQHCVQIERQYHNRLMRMRWSQLTLALSSLRNSQDCRREFIITLFT